MQNEFSMRHKPIDKIMRKCSSVDRFYEIVTTMPDPSIVVLLQDGVLTLCACNRSGICTYIFKRMEHDLYPHDKVLIEQLRLLAKKHPNRF